MKSPGALLRVLGLFCLSRPLRFDLKELLVDEVHHAEEVAELCASYPVITGVCTQCDVTDRHLPSESAVEPVISEGVESPEVERMPLSRRELVVCFRV